MNVMKLSDIWMLISCNSGKTVTSILPILLGWEKFQFFFIAIGKWGYKIRIIWIMCAKNESLQNFIGV